MQINLLSVKNDTKNRFDDIQIMLDFLSEKNKVDCQLVLKSSIILIVYNAIEGTFSNLIAELFDAISQNKFRIDQLPKGLQNTIFEYHLKKIGQSPVELKKCYNSDSVALCSVSYLEISKYLKLFSGNLDSRSIKRISKKLGINLKNVMDEPVLLKVKNIRNKLAHGEIRFRTACQDITSAEMNEIVTKAKNYLNNLINAYENFLQKI